MNSENAKKVKNYLKNKGLSNKEITALMANIAVESGYTFDSTKKQEGERSDPAYGLFQFDPRGKGLSKIYQQYLSDTEKKDSMESQLDFMVDSLNKTYKAGTEYIGYGNVKKYNDVVKEGTVEDITKFFSENVLRPGTPHMDRRLQAAQDLLPLVYEQNNKDEINAAAAAANTFPEAMQ